MSGDDTDIEIKVVSRLGSRERRALVRGLFRQIKPWLKLFKSAVVGHAGHGTVYDRRDRKRGMKAFSTAPLDSLAGKLGYEIQILRTEAGMSQSELAKAVGIQRSHLSHIERGLSYPRAKTLRAIQAKLRECLD